jgi:hypothetical protein
MKDKIVYQIHDRKDDEVQYVYSRSYHNVSEFGSTSSARSSNCYDIYENKEKYRIAKYKVTYELIEEDCE